MKLNKLVYVYRVKTCAAEKGWGGSSAVRLARLIIRTCTIALSSRSPDSEWGFCSESTVWRNPPRTLRKTPALRSAVFSAINLGIPIISNLRKQIMRH